LTLEPPELVGLFAVAVDIAAAALGGTAGCTLFLLLFFVTSSPSSSLFPVR
jgi:hypothetical protein